MVNWCPATHTAISDEEVNMKPQNGFLYKMVRNITGTLLEIATHKRPLGDLPTILASKDRTQAGQTAPAQALFLYHVEY